MLNEFIKNYKRKIEVPFYNAAGELENQELHIKPLSLSDLMWIMDDEVCGYYLAKIFDGLDILEGRKDEVKERITAILLNSDYSKLLIAVIAASTNVKMNETLLPLKQKPEIAGMLPVELQIEILNHILELSLPLDISKFQSNIKKIMAHLGINQKV